MLFGKAFEQQTLGTLVLGAAQLGMAYGVANRTGKPDATRADAILSEAWRRGIRIVDTAQTYGDSEKLIGEHIARHPDHDFRIITKLSAATGLDGDAIIGAATRSRDVFGRRMASLMLHDASSVERWNSRLEAALMACIDRGLTETIGVSIYTPDQFRAALGIPSIGVLQAPFNVLDRRLLEDHLLEQAMDDGRIVILRSVFLQGLLTLAADDVPPRLRFAEEALAGWRRICARHGVAAAAAAMRYVRHAAPRALLAVGCETPAQVASNAMLAQGSLPSAMINEIESMPLPEERVVNPSLWPQQ